MKFVECRGQNKQGDDVEELEANAEEQHLDADVEIRSSTFSKTDDVAVDGAAAASEQMPTEEKSTHIFVSSKTEVFENIGGTSLGVVHTLESIQCV